MRTRFSSIALAAFSIAIGLGLGLQLGRGGGAILAQVGPAVGSDRGPSARAEVHRISQVEQSDAKVYDELARQYATFEHIDRMFESVSRAVRPTVVHIVTQKTTRREEGRRVRKFEETGSGVIVRSDRSPGLFVLTNHHVVGGDEGGKVHIFLQDGRSLEPERVWTDPEADIAVLKLDRDDLPAARLGDSDNARVGSWVLALGSPFGLTHSVSQGIISARGRHMDELEEVKNQDFLQTDAAINPGNSGGPLVNMRGEVIGINNSIASNGGGNEGVGFSIPINLARWIMNDLLVNGRVRRGGLGVDLHPDFRPEEAADRGLDRPRGALIDRVHPGSPAALGGVLDGDVILNFGGIPIQDLNQLINAVSMSPVGQAADVVVWRDRREVRLQVTVGDRDRALGPILDSPPSNTDGADAAALIRRPHRPDAASSYAMGLELLALEANLATRLGLPNTMRGALIVNVDEESPLLELCRANDVISSINDQSIGSAEQAVELLNGDGPAPLIISIDRFEKGEIERHTIRIPR